MVSDADRWSVTSKTIGWFNPYEWPWRISDLCDFDSWRWVPYANCKDIADPEMFFQAAASTRRHHELLSRICDSCVVRAECLEHALVHEEYGWWGGTSEEDRARILGEA